MKQFIAFTLCLSISVASFAQKNATDAKKNPSHKSAIAGVIQNMRKQPIMGIKAFIYYKDSIVASGFTDSTGYFETNYAVPGIYNLKLVYPSEKTMVITAVPIKARTLTMVDLKAMPPEADTSIAYAAIAPKTPQTPKGTSAPKH
ncbi:MAG: hypothetical protein ACHQD8_02590 [Chitinophagales bacterium]